MTIPPAHRSTRLPVEGTYNFREAAPGLLRPGRLTVTDDLREMLSGSPEAALRDTLRWLDDEYGGVVSYLERVGVDDEVVARLQQELERRTP